MENRINDYLNCLFESAPQNQRAFELREEMKQNLIEKYRDLLEEGNTPEQAYYTAIESLGDISELFDDLRREEPSAVLQSTPVTQGVRKKNALAIAIAVALFILSPMATVICGELLDNALIGVCIFFFMIAAGVGIIIYSHMTKSVSSETYENASDDGIDKNCGTQEQKIPTTKSRVCGAVQTALWCLTVALYFAVSFITMKWYITWAMFLICSALSALIRLIFDADTPKKIVGAVQSAFWCIVIASYFMISFRTFAWHITWVIFLIGAALSTLIGLIGSGGGRKNVLSAIQGFMWCAIVALYFVISFATMAWHITWVMFLVGAAISVVLAAVGKEQ